MSPTTYWIGQHHIPMRHGCQGLGFSVSGGGGEEYFIASSCPGCKGLHAKARGDLIQDPTRISPNYALYVPMSYYTRQQTLSLRLKTLHQEPALS